MKPCKRDALCRQCAALLAECGDDLFDHYRKKLLIRGWSNKSPVERAYMTPHSVEKRIGEVYKRLDIQHRPDLSARVVAVLMYLRNPPTAPPRSC